MDKNAELVVVLVILALVGAYLNIEWLSMGAAIFAALMVVMLYAKPNPGKHGAHDKSKGHGHDDHGKGHDDKHAGHHAGAHQAAPMLPPPIIVVDAKPNVQDMITANIVGQAYAKAKDKKH